MPFAGASPAFTITAVTLHTTPIQVGGQSIVAGLTVQYAGLIITGLNLTRLENGEPRVFFPRMGRGCRIVLQNPADRDALLRLALDSYRTLTGREFAAPPVAKASLETDTLA